MNLAAPFFHPRASATFRILKLILLAHFLAAFTTASEQPVPLSEGQWLAFEAPFVIEDGKIQFSATQRFLEEPNSDVVGKLIDTMASKDAVDVGSLLKLFQVYFQRVNKQLPILNLSAGNYVADARLRALASAFCHEQSRFPTKHRAGMGLVERQLFSLCYAICLGTCISTIDFIQPPPVSIQIDEENFRDPEKWKIQSGEEWLRVHDPEVGRQSIFDRKSCSIRIFCHPSAESRNSVVALGLQILEPKKLSAPGGGSKE